METATLPEVHKTGGLIGAELRGLDLTREYPDETYEAVRQAWAEHGVIFFRDQHLTDEQRENFARRFGEIRVKQEVRKEPEQTRAIGEGWHTDMTCFDEPPIATILFAGEVPPYGGDTQWAGMGPAFEALSEGLRGTLLGLRAVHANVRKLGLSYEQTDPPEPSIAEYDAAEGPLHPVVRLIPETGRRVLYVNPEFTTRFEGWTRRESLPLLRFLFDHGVQPEFVTRFTWAPGSIAFWDNRQVWHFAVNDYQGQRRVMNRILLKGAKPIPAGLSAILAIWADMGADQVDALVIFGATGDLAKLETFPALVGLADRGVLTMPVIGVAKSGWGLSQFRDYAIASLKLNNMDPDSPAAVKMLDLLRYVDGDLADPATYEAMSAELGSAQRILYYLEVPPALFGRIAEGISGAGRAAGSRVMVEKPFGHDLASAQALNETMHKFFPEEAIYRVDHWLGLDPVESLMFARFANSVVEPLLNRNYVQSIQITMAEAFDVADRGSFYDKTGAIKDVVQNHMLQVLATVLADPPDGSGLDSWITSKSQLIGALAPLGPADVVKGQYDGYLSVPGVAPGSTTETFVAVRLAADSWRWAGVPILIRAGKCLPVTATEVSIRFKRPPHDPFGLGDRATANGLRFRVYPENRATLILVGKKPGAGWEPEVQELVFAEHPGAEMRPYDRLIGAALNGERWLFAQQDTVEACWRVVDPALGDVGPVVPYARGSWGPDASALLPEGETWYDPAG